MRKKSIKFIKDYLKTLPDTKTIEFNGFSFEVLQYLPVVDKLTMVDVIIELSTVITDTGYSYIDKTTLEIIKDYMLVDGYTNLKVSDNFTEIYDLVHSTDLIWLIIANIPPSELELINSYLKESIDKFEAQEKYNNSIKATVIAFIKGLQENVPELIKTMDEFDPDKLKFIKDYIDSSNKK